MEPTELSVAPVQAGCLNFRVRVQGRAAHGAVRQEGISAFEKLFAVYDALRQLEDRRNARVPDDPLFARYALPFPISVGTISGGDWASSVPDHVAMEGRLGVIPGETLETARADLEEAVAQAARRDDWLSTHPPIVEWWGGRFLPSRMSTDHPLTVALAEASSAVSGESAPIEGVTFGADAGLLTHVGRTPTLLFGAGDIRRAHRPDEYIDVDDLERMARVVAVAVMRFCG
jgi:acetylornithine deacetylase